MEGGGDGQAFLKPEFAHGSHSVGIRESDQGPSGPPSSGQAADKVRLGWTNDKMTSSGLGGASGVPAAGGRKAGLWLRDGVSETAVPHTAFSWIMSVQVPWGLRKKQRWLHNRKGPLVPVDVGHAN